MTREGLPATEWSHASLCCRSVLGGGELSWPQPAGAGSEMFQIVLQHLALSTAEPVSSAVVPLRKRV